MCLCFHFPHCILLSTEDRTEGKLGNSTHTHRALTNIRGTTYPGTCNGSPPIPPPPPASFATSLTYHHMKTRIFFQVRITLFLSYFSSYILAFLFTIRNVRALIFSAYCLLPLLAQHFSAFSTTSTVSRHMSRSPWKSGFYAHSSRNRIQKWGAEVLVICFMNTSSSEYVI